MLLWSAFFWYVAAYGLTDKYLAGGERIAAMPGVVTMSVLAYEGVGSLLDWQALRRGMRVAWILMPTAALWQLAHGVHPAQDGGWLAWPSLYVVSLWIFRRQERQRPVTGAAVMRGLTLWLPTVLATIEFVWWTVELKLGGAWHTAAYCLPSILALLSVPSMRHHWPVRGNERIFGLLGPLSLAAGAWLIYANIRSPGTMSPLPYLPLANPLDATVALALIAALRLRPWHTASGSPLPAYLDNVLAVFGFFWANAIALRSIHFLAGIPYRFDALMASMPVQATLSLLWTGTAMALMVAARLQARPVLWVTGAALLCVVLVDLASSGTIARIVSFLGVGGLLLAIGYLAPVPPGTPECEGKG